MEESGSKPFSEWIERTSESEDVITERLAASFRALFDPHLAPVEDDEAPLCIHWCLSPPVAPMAELGPDGHPAKNRDLPPVPAPRRMWAGGSISTFGALRIGDHVKRQSTITDVTLKQGRSGELWFVTVNHDYLARGRLAIRERQDIVYRPANVGGAQTAAREEPEAPRKFNRSWSINPSPTYLFRYSAITFNGHRIHYDLPYAQEVEGYPGLIVHGPLQATLLFNLAATVEGTMPARFDYRGLSPAFAGEDLLVCAGDAATERFYWTQGAGGQRHMEATTTGGS